MGLGVGALCGGILGLSWGYSIAPMVVWLVVISWAMLMGGVYTAKQRGGLMGRPLAWPWALGNRLLKLAWGWVSLALILVAWPWVLLRALHLRLAALCWEGREFKSRQQQRLWNRGRARDLRVFRGWRCRQWYLAAVLVLLLLLSWCSTAAHAMDTFGVEANLLVTAGIAVLKARHPGGAARVFLGWA
mgnify:FL=1